MDDSSDRPQSAAAVPDVVVEGRRGLPLVWLIPVLAAAIAAWLAYNTYARQGPTITITFDGAAGLEEGKTEIKYRDVALGVVQDVDLSADLSHVVVTAQMDTHAADHLREDTQFWIENARVTASGISGLGTLVSGAYIGVLPGTGKHARHFKGMEDPPVLEVNVPGRRFTLHADKSVAAAAPIFHRGVQVGEVLGSSLAADGAGVTVFAFVRAPYDALVRPQTHFWSAGGIDVSLDAKGLAVRTGSLVSVLVGGIAFDSPKTASAGEPSPEGAEFTLYDSYASIQEAQYTQKVPYIMYFQGSVAGLEPGAPVQFHGIQLGVVESVRLEIDLETFRVRIPVVMQLQPQRASVVGADEAATPQERMERFVERGLRAQLRSGNLLTGALVVALDFFPGQPPAKLAYEDGYAVIPTLPSQVEQLTEKATVFLDKVAAAPVAELVADLRRVVLEADALLASKALRQGLDGVAPLMSSLQRTADAAHAALAQGEATLQSANGAIGPDSALRYDLARLLSELTDTARSLRTLADYLERNPNALIFGKSPSGD